MFRLSQNNEKLILSWQAHYGSLYLKGHTSQVIQLHRCQQVEKQEAESAEKWRRCCDQSGCMIQFTDAFCL
jgi:hypothetical protein